MFVLGLGDADAGGGADAEGARAVVVGADLCSDIFSDFFSEPQAAGGGGEIAIVVAGTGDGESFAEASGAAGECDQVLGILDFEAAGPGHYFDAGERFEGAEKNAAGAALGFAGDVEAVVIAVDEVDVGVAGGAEEDGIAGGAAGGGVSCGVVFSEVGFDFDDAGGERIASAIADEDFAEEFAGHAAGIAVVEGAVQGMDVGGLRRSLWCGHGEGF